MMIAIKKFHNEQKLVFFVLHMLDLPHCWVVGWSFRVAPTHIMIGMALLDDRSMTVSAILAYSCSSAGCNAA